MWGEERNLPNCRLSCDPGQGRGARHSPATRGTRFYPVPKRSAGSEPPCTQRAQSSPCPAETGPNKGKTRLGERISSRDALSKSPLRWGGSRRGPGSPRQPRAPRDVPTSPAPGSCCRRPQRPAPGGLIRQTISHLFPTDFLKPTPAPPHCGLRLQTAVEDSSNQSLCFALALPASRGSRVCHVGKLPRANEASESSAGARLPYSKPGALPSRQVGFLNQISSSLKHSSGSAQR